mmetsp:Transcript_73915/g.121945  ORF Transcript_73915/g.121945 Transcript_73915/m.121945 type:complete len:239 (-) Transcript_73915:60-776(-)
MAEGKVQPVSLAWNMKEVQFRKEGKEPMMRMTLELSIDFPVTKLVVSLDEAFGKSDETKQKESVPLISKESTPIAPPRYQETSNSTSTRRMESEKPKSLSLSVSTATPTIPQEVPVPQPAPVPPAKAPKYSRQTHPDYVKSQRWNRKDQEGEKDVFFIDMEAFRNAQFEPLPEPSRKELVHANYKEVDWRIGDVPPPLVVDDEKENQEPEGDKVAQEHQSVHKPPSRVGAHAEKCALQ